uniref:ATP synthase subunit delta n=1 Tax=Candidatus Kentrum sp. FM TaxID=2126340 RepID=A0A450RYI8_9GAMM|nr:MAG: F-type H+-transporting ATPase subunit delta [Candidatus Kentron sp. FM]VFJ44576.1 MAG: F-type H+-transporting ATPase subunit delta [Candidatus Kentron sp. FM]VFK06538.1 MAG: F-type H+-transporting ATPase subunit delta [Candidatus Kentron sp. FM]
MAEKNTLARPYAIAAFRQAQEERKLDRWLGMLHFLVAVAADPDMAKIIKDPRVSKSYLTELLLDITKKNLSKTGENFVRVLVEAGRMEVISEILQLFEKELDKFEKRSRIQVTSAYPLTPAYRQDIEAAMKKRLGREVETSVAVDKSLIGGVVIHAGDVVIDISLRGRLTQLGLDLS